MPRPTIEELTGRNSLSYSSLDTFQQCGEKFRLTRVHKVTEEQAYWMVGGSAFHTASEWFDQGDNRSLHELWREAWNAEYEKLDLSRPIRAGGRATKAYPNKEDHTWWNQHGPEMLNNYAIWRRNSGWEIYTDNGHPFIEYQFTLTLPNPFPADDASPELALTGYVDRVFVTPNGEVVICDLKTGSKEPASSLQLGIYCAGLRQRGGLNASLGCYYMARKGEPGATLSLHHYTDDLLAYWLGMFEDNVRSQKFLPHVTSMCQTCMVAPSCYAVGGKPPYKLPFVSQ